MFGKFWTEHGTFLYFIYRWNFIGWKSGYAPIGSKPWIWVLTTHIHTLQIKRFCVWPKALSVPTINTTKTRYFLSGGRFINPINFTRKHTENPRKFSLFLSSGKRTIRRRRERKRDRETKGGLWAFLEYLIGTLDQVFISISLFFLFFLLCFLFSIWS